MTVKFTVNFTVVTVSKCLEDDQIRCYNSKENKLNIKFSVITRNLTVRTVGLVNSELAAITVGLVGVIALQGRQ